MSNNLINAKCRLLITDPWYGIFISKFKWKKEVSERWFTQKATIGVRFNNGFVECCYSPDFIATLTMEQTIAVLKHEVEHIVRMHLSRARYYKGNPHYAKIWNIAADWVINGYKEKPRIEDLPIEGLFIPDHTNQEDRESWASCDINKLRGDMTTEEFFDWFKENTKVSTRTGDQDNSSGGGSGSDGNNLDSEKVVETKGGKILDVLPMDNHGGWDNSGVSPEEMRRIAKDLANTSSRHTGKTPGHLQSSIASLEKPQHNWVYKFRQHIGRMLGGKRKTYSRRNRKNDQFGVKGISSHAAIRLVIGVDTSGSMSEKMLRKVFAEIEQMSQYFKILLIQFDYGVNDMCEYHRGDWRKITLKGRGGTSFKSFFDYIEEHGLIGQMNIVLTDGYDTLPQEKPYPVTWVVVGEMGLNYNNFWGEVVLIEDDYE